MAGSIFRNGINLDNLCGKPQDGQLVNPVSTRLGKEYTLGCEGYIYSKNVDIPATLNGVSYLWDAYGIRPTNTLRYTFSAPSNSVSLSPFINIGFTTGTTSLETLKGVFVYSSTSEYTTYTIPKSIRAIVVGLGGGGGDSGGSDGANGGSGGGGGGYILATIYFDYYWSINSLISGTKYGIHLDNGNLTLHILDDNGSTQGAYVYANRGSSGKTSSTSTVAGGTSGSVGLDDFAEYIYIMAKQNGGIGGAGDGGDDGESGGEFPSITGTYNPEGLGITAYQPSGGNGGGSSSGSQNGSGGGGSGPYGIGGKAQKQGQNDGVDGGITAGASGGAGKTWSLTKREGASGGVAQVRIYY